MFFFNRQSLEETAARLLAKLRDSRRQVIGQMQTAPREQRVPTPEQIAQPAIEAGAQLAQIEDQARASADRLKAERVAASQVKRLFQIERRILRPARTQDIPLACFVLMCCLFGDGALTAGLMVGNGDMDVPTAIIYGLTIASINVATGVTAGFFCGRFMGYKLRATEVTPQDRQIRWTARGGFAAFILSTLTLLFGAARVRATGSHSGIFDFSEISLAATFNDYYAIGIVVVGVIATVVAFYKGMTGFSDPEPGYTEIHKAASDDILAAARQAESHLRDSASAIFIGGANGLEDQYTAAQDAIAGRDASRFGPADAVLMHNNEVAHAKDTLRTLEARQRWDIGFIAQGKQPPRPMNLDAFDRLLIEEIGPMDGGAAPGLADIEPDRDMRAFLQSRYAHCLLVIGEAFASVRTDAPLFEFGTQ